MQTDGKSLEQTTQAVRWPKIRGPEDAQRVVKELYGLSVAQLMDVIEKESGSLYDMPETLKSLSFLIGEVAYGAANAGFQRGQEAAATDALADVRQSSIL